MPESTAASLAAFLEKTIPFIESHLDRLVSENKQPYHKLHSAARYALLGGGKRLRPILVIAAAEALGGDREKAIIPACAIEMIHTYSMIHDDLPCMDDDDFRRGKPTLHRAFPEAHAVLAGDFLLTYSFELLATAPLMSHEQQANLVALLARRSGASGMIGGQIMDIEAEGKPAEIALLELIHRYKTGALMRAAVEMGAIVSCADKKESAAIAAYGDALGLAFQIIDDLLDLGKNSGKHTQGISSDLLKDKMTCVKFYGEAGAKAKAEELVKIAKSHLEEIEGPTEILKGVAERLLHGL